jgi:TonB family protein
MSIALPSMLERVRISRRQFVASLVIAFFIHTMFFGALDLVPRKEVTEIPVKTLNIKLGNALSGEEEALLEEASVPEANNQQIEASLENAFATQTDDAASAISAEVLTQQRQTPVPQTATQQTAIGKQGVMESQAAKQYVRERKAPQIAPQVAGNTLGNTQYSSQMQVQAYTQTIALWMDKFKIYPEEAKNKGMQGRAMVRIRIDRRGNVHYRILSEQTAYPLLNKAVLDMVRRANPVPPVPADYPLTDEYLEFVIPVLFKLDK